MTIYEPEILDEWEDNGTMVESRCDLENALVGHKIVSVERGEATRKYYGTDAATIITLDNGKRVKLIGEADCCAFTEVQAFLLNPEMVGHLITGVGTTGEYTTWHIYADMGDILQLTVGWSCGNPFYYGYGFTIQVEDIDEGL
jgi:hypothetical protein